MRQNRVRNLFGGSQRAPAPKHLKESVGSASRLTLKHHLRILSRRDRMGKARPSPVRILVFLAFLLAVTQIVSYYTNQSIRNNHSVATPKSDTQVQLSFVGDVSMARYINQYAERYGYETLFAQSKELWANSDLVFANLECAIVDDESKYEEVDKVIHLPAPPEALYAVQNSGINALSIANNHSIDYGEEGLAYELSLLDSLGMLYAGAGNTMEEAAAPVILECGGLKVGFLAFSGIPMDGFFFRSTTVATASYAELYRNIRETADQTDLMIVYAHWGKENALSLSSTQESIAHQLVESGADIVIGSHPHVLQEAEIYRDGIIFYSLGNYLLDQGARDNRTSAMVQLNLDQETGEGEFLLIPIRINNFVPQETQTKLYINEVQHLLTQSLQSDQYYTTEDGRIHIPVRFSLQ